MSRFADLLKNAESVHKKERELPKVATAVASKWSEQQEKFLNTQSPKLVLTALAGSGKTSCLLEYARRRRHQKWNFVVFNRSVADEVALRAPENMKVQTAHQMAYAHFGHDLHHKIKHQISLSEIQQHIKWVGHQAQKDFASLVKDVFDQYLNSSDVQITEHLVSEFEWESFQRKHSDMSWELSQLLKAVEDIWRASLDPQSDFSISHDVYLKRFSMVSDPWKGTFWMLDEGQDWSDAFLSCFKRSAAVSIRTGDPYQKLYDWRGASRQKWCDPAIEKELWLTDSYRTSKGVEPWVNARLRSLACPRVWQSALTEQCSIVMAEENAKNIQSFSPTVVLATRWEDLEKISRQLDEYGVANCLNKNSSGTKEGIVLTTIHSAKGLEFERVWIADNALPLDEHAVQKARLSYVALTRAQKSVRIPNIWPHTVNSVSLFDDF